MNPRLASASMKNSFSIPHGRKRDLEFKAGGPHNASSTIATHTSNARHVHTELLDPHIGGRWLDDGRLRDKPRSRSARKRRMPVLISTVQTIFDRLRVHAIGVSSGEAHR